MSHAGNVAISFPITSILAGPARCWLGLVAGGPMAIALGRAIVGSFALLVGIGTGEVRSADSTAGGLEEWSPKPARRKQARWARCTGSFDLVGQFGFIAAVDNGPAVFVGYVIRLLDTGFSLTVGHGVALFLVLSVAHGLLDTSRIDHVKILATSACRGTSPV